MAKIISIKKGTTPSGDTITDAIKKYESLLKDFPRNESYYDRLMILYRKEKNYKKELTVIEKGIKVFEQLMKPKTAPAKNIVAISKKLNKAFGLTDAKGNAMHVHQPVAKWQKRKAVVLKKISQA